MDELYNIVHNIKKAQKNMSGGDAGYENDFNEDCKDYNFLPSVFPPVRRIIAIGDLHGDIKMTLDCLKIANLIQDANILNSNHDIEYNKLMWTGGDTIVVQIGDQVDRCRPVQFKCDDPRSMGDNDEASDIRILKLFTFLDTQAREHGGHVISILGNHEIMNVMGNMNYVSYMGLEEFDGYVDPKDQNIKFQTGKEARIHAFKPGNELGSFLGCTRLSAIIIGANLFVHAGLLPEFASKIGLNSKEDLEKVNQSVRKWLVGKINNDNINQIVGSFKDSMFWTRVMGSIPPEANGEECEKFLKPVLQTLNISSMIVGHTPQFYMNNQGINQACDNGIWRIDNGVSGAFDKFDSNTGTNRTVQVLEILNDNQFNILKISEDSNSSSIGQSA